MNGPELPSLPFLTRDMLRFGNVSPLRLFLRVQAVTANDIFIKGITRSGIISHRVTTIVNGATTESRMGVPDIPIMVSVVDIDGNWVQGECYAQLYLELSENVRMLLCQGFVSRMGGISWPAVQREDARPGGGQIVQITTANPAAGAEISETVPAGQTWKILYGSVTFVTDATAANRTPRIIFTHSEGATIASINGTAITANDTKILTLGHYGEPSGFNFGDRHLFALPANMYLDGESTITTSTSNIQAGDNYGAMGIVIERFFEPD